MACWETLRMLTSASHHDLHGITVVCTKICRHCQKWYERQNYRAYLKFCLRKQVIAYRIHTCAGNLLNYSTTPWCMHVGNECTITILRTSFCQIAKNRFLVSVPQPCSSWRYHKQMGLQSNAQCFPVKPNKKTHICHRVLCKTLLGHKQSQCTVSERTSPKLP